MVLSDINELTTLVGRGQGTSGVAVPKPCFQPLVSFCVRVWAPVCVCANIRACFLSLAMTIFIPDLAQFAAIFSIYSHFLKSKVLNGEAFFFFTFWVPAGARVGGT